MALACRRAAGKPSEGGRRVSFARSNTLECLLCAVLIRKSRTKARELKTTWTKMDRMLPIVDNGGMWGGGCSLRPLAHKVRGWRKQGREGSLTFYAILDSLEIKPESWVGKWM